MTGCLFCLFQHSVCPFGFSIHPYCHSICPLYTIFIHQLLMYMCIIHNYILYIIHTYIHTHTYMYIHQLISLSIHPFSASGNINADKYFLPLELAFRSNIPRVVNISLDCVQVCYMYTCLFRNMC